MTSRPSSEKKKKKKKKKYKKIYLHQKETPDPKKSQPL
jgi:hypothetical protein